MSLDAPLFDTAPPEPPLPLAVRLKRRLKAEASGLVMPVLRKAAGAYIGGETLGEALTVATRLKGDGLAATLGFWDKNGESPDKVAEVCLDAVRALAGSDGCVSLKPPVLRYDPALAAALAHAAAKAGISLYCDSHGWEAAEPSFAFAEALKLGGARLGVTLPGRWWRSLHDAEWAIAHGAAVRVVKGQWPDPGERDMAQGFLELVERLAGRARFVSVATHDFALGSQAIARLKEAGTPCEASVLLGVPAAPLMRWAKTNGVALRVYVPFGPGFVPNALGVLRRNPRLLWAVAKDRFAAVLGPR